MCASITSRGHVQPLKQLATKAGRQRPARGGGRSQARCAHPDRTPVFPHHYRSRSPRGGRFTSDYKPFSPASTSSAMSSIGAHLDIEATGPLGPAVTPLPAGRETDVSAQGKPLFYTSVSFLAFSLVWQFARKLYFSRLYFSCCIFFALFCFWLAIARGNMNLLLYYMCMRTVVISQARSSTELFLSR
jgi:hypothetical protein